MVYAAPATINNLQHYAPKTGVLSSRLVANEMSIVAIRFGEGRLLA